MRLLNVSVLTILLSAALTGVSVAGGVGGFPAPGSQSLDRVPLVSFPVLDFRALAAEDLEREENGLPDRFAVPRDVSLSPENSGTWETLPGGRNLWRLRVSCPDVLSLNLGFHSYRLPVGAILRIYASDQTGHVLHFDSDDNRSSGQLWTPVLLTTELVVELEVSAENREIVSLELGRIGCGYRYFGEDFSQKSGLCNIDVVCPEGDDWRGDIASVGMYSVGGVQRCSGVMVNNTSEDQRPLFLTANHCPVYDHNVASVVVYWNYESPACGDHSGGSLLQFSSGDSILAASSISDFKLLELAGSPDPVFGVTYAGWDRSGDLPENAVCIHHPSTDEKSISFEDDELRITTYLADVGPGDATHLRVGDWDLGTTEGGSSGSPLFDADHRIVGQLHGGYADCSNDRPDWYGRIFTSWEGGGSAATRLRDHLDPTGTGAVALNRLGSLDPDPEPLPPGEMVLSLSSVSPNPFLVSVELTYQINQAALVTGKVFNIAGQLILDLGSADGTEGENSWTWNGNDRLGHPAPAGLYIILLESLGQKVRGQVVRLK